MSEYYPVMTPPLLNKINFDGMNKYGYNLLLGTALKIDDINSHPIAYLNCLYYITNYLTDHTQTIPMEEYLKEVNSCHSQNQIARP